MYSIPDVFSVIFHIYYYLRTVGKIMQDFAIDFFERKSNILLGKLAFGFKIAIFRYLCLVTKQKNVPSSIWNFDNPLLGGKKHSTDFCLLNIGEVI